MTTAGPFLSVFFLELTVRTTDIKSDKCPPETYDLRPETTKLPPSQSATVGESAFDSVNAKDVFFSPSSRGIK